jgi:hypothetical protein
MWKTALLVLSTTYFTLGQNFEGLVTNTFYVGIALPSGNGSAETRPGPSLCIEPVRNLSKYVSVGGHLDYLWLTCKKPSSVTEEFSMGGHILDIAFVPKAIYPFNDNFSASFEFDPGIYLSYYYFTNGTESNSEAKPCFGLTTGLSCKYKAICIAIRYKTLFAKKFEQGYGNMLSEDNNPDIITISIGTTL